MEVDRIASEVFVLTTLGNLKQGKKAPLLAKDPVYLNTLELYVASA